MPVLSVRHDGGSLNPPVSKDFQESVLAFVMTTIHIIDSWADLLGGITLSDCRNVTDPSCVGGVANVAAFARHLTRSGASVTDSPSGGTAEDIEEPYIVTPRLDRYSPFVQMHPLGWSVNRLIFVEVLQWKFFISSPALLYLSSTARGSTNGSSTISTNSSLMSDLQTDELPFLLTNVAVPPENDWYPYTKAIYFDETTHLAFLSVADSDEPLNVPQIESATGALNYIARLNKESDCDAFVDDGGGTAVALGSSWDNRTCWIPVVAFGDSENRWNNFLLAMTALENPPSLIMDIEGHDARFFTPQKYNQTWVSSYKMNSTTYRQQSIVLAEDSRTIVSVTATAIPLNELPDEFKDNIYTSHVTRMYELGQEAANKDPIVGTSTFMPIARIDQYRRCMGGECEIGNLFTDALRWYSSADVAFVSSGGLRGQGWPEGVVQMSNLWESLPFPNTLCSGTMTGVSLFKLFNYSTSVANFEVKETVSGGQLLQVSGARLRYNTKLPQGASRMVRLEIWDKNANQYAPVQRLQLYKFATDNFLCETNIPYPELLGQNFYIDGEDPGVVRDDLHQNIVADYLTQLNTTYQATIEGRLINDTTVLDAMNLVQIEGGCGQGTYWVFTQQSCKVCPNTDQVYFGKKELEFASESGSSKPVEGRFEILNNAGFPVSVGPRSFPFWVTLTVFLCNGTIPIDPIPAGVTRVLQSGEKLTVGLSISSEQLEAGTAVATGSFSVVDGGSFPGCIGNEISFDILVRVDPSRELNQIGGIRWVGWSLFMVLVFSAMFFYTWVCQHERIAVVRAMHRLFLNTVCLGIVVLGSVLIPVGFDDGAFSENICNSACASIPWISAAGLSTIFAAMYRKLGSIVGKNEDAREFRGRRVVLTFAVFFGLNASILVPWSILAPLHWDRTPLVQEEWKSYGRCSTSDTSSLAFVVMAGVLNVSGFVLICRLAYKAQQIQDRRDQFDQAKSISLALYSWIQLAVVGIPVLSLISAETTRARYFMIVALIFALCISMLLSLFIPMQMQKTMQSVRTLSLGSRFLSSFRSR